MHSLSLPCIRHAIRPFIPPIMFDILLRPLKDQTFDPLCSVIPKSISPLQITGAAFVSGAASCVAAVFSRPWLSFSLWIFNRILDCLDGAVARQRGQSSDLGGFLDLLSDFVIYSAIPICCALGHTTAMDQASLQRRWFAVAAAEASFHVNNFVLFFVAAVTERKKTAEAKEGAEGKGASAKELTSVSMRPALVEGMESGVLFTLMLALPEWTEILCWVLSAGVTIGIAQRVSWTVVALSK